MYLLGLVLGFFWGIGQNLQWEWLYAYGTGPGDWIFLGYLTLCAASPALRAPLQEAALRLRSYATVIAVFVALTLLSSTVNAYVWGIEARDIIEAVRPLYYLLLVLFVAAWTFRYGLFGIVVAFLCGISVAGVDAYLEPAWRDFAGTNVLWNPNGIGNLLAIGVVMASLLIAFERSILVPAIFTTAFLTLSIFTFSKGTWLMALAGFGACVTAAVGARKRLSIGRLGKAVLTLTAFALIVIVLRYAGSIVELVALKLQATQYGDSASEGGTLAQRFGFVIASWYMATSSPLIGVGISNYEQAYDGLRDYLGDYFWETDNPHSAWLYVMACMGFPALLLFAVIVFFPFTKLPSALQMKAAAKGTYLACILTVVVLSGSVLLHLLTQYYSWFMAGVLFGVWSRAKAATRMG